MSRVKLAWSFLFFLATNADRRGLRGKGRHEGSIIIIIIGTAIFEVLSESVGRLSKCFLCALPDFRCNPIAAKERGGGEERSVLTQSDYLIKPIMLQHTPTHNRAQSREEQSQSRTVTLVSIHATDHGCQPFKAFLRSVLGTATEASTIFRELSPNLIAHCCLQRNLRNTCQSMQQCYIGSGTCNVQLATNWREREREFCKAW